MPNSPISESLSKAVRAKTGGVVSLRILWENAIRSALKSGSSEVDLLEWISAFSSPRLFDRFVADHVRSGESLAETRVSIAKDSDEVGMSFADFVAGIEQVLLFAEGKGTSTRPSTVEGYVFCAAEFLATKTIQEPLAPTVKEMLDLYGFDG